jgi:hypothetical protein
MLASFWFREGVGSPVSAARAVATSVSVARTYVVVALPVSPAPSVCPAWAWAMANPKLRSTQVKVVWRIHWVQDSPNRHPRVHTSGEEDGEQLTRRLRGRGPPG